MYETTSLFDAMEHEYTDRRVSSRRALALAHTRVDQRMGAFFEGATSEDEFKARLALVEEDFVHLVNSAAEECGHDHPEHIAASLIDHYRLGAGVKFEETPEEEEEPKEAAVKTADMLGGPVAPQVDPSMFGAAPGHGQAPGTAAPMPTPQAGGAAAQVGGPAMPQVPGQVPGVPPVPGAQQQGIPQPGQAPQPPVLGKFQWTASSISDTAGKQGSPLANTAAADSSRDMANDVCNQCGAETTALTHGVCSNCIKKMGKTAGDATCDQCNKPMNPVDKMVGGTCMACAQKNNKSVTGADNNPSDQQSNENDSVTCPVCGGSDSKGCSKCAGTGKVKNFGGSALDALFAHTARTWHVADGPPDQHNTDLGGPEPVINKSQGPGPQIKPEDSGRWPTKRKDITEPIKAVNDDPLKEIGEKTTETVELDSAPDFYNDAGFASGGEEHGPHTKTFGDKGQTDPVTHETQSSYWPSATVVDRAFAAL
jgi:hypothetical protein